MREKRSDARVISATTRVISSLGNNKKSRERAHDTLRMPCDKSANRLCELRRDCHIYTQAGVWANETNYSRGYISFRAGTPGV